MLRNYLFGIDIGVIKKIWEEPVLRHGPGSYEISDPYMPNVFQGYRFDFENRFCWGKAVLHWAILVWSQGKSVDDSPGIGHGLP